MLDSWRKNLENLLALRGQTLVALGGNEMALWEFGPDDRPKFRCPTIPLVQVNHLILRMADGRQLRLTTCPSDQDGYGLALDLQPEGVDPPVEQEPGSIYRAFVAPEPRQGEIDEVVPCFDPDDPSLTCVCALRMSIGGKRLWMVAAEAHERFDGGLDFAVPGESILLFFRQEDWERSPLGHFAVL